MGDNNNPRVCGICGIRPAPVAATRTSKGSIKRYYKKECKTCYKYPNLGDKAKTTTCRGCLKDYHPICLDVDHTDGNKKNESYSNLQILCANCHRLKSMLCGDHTNKGKQ